MKIHVVVHKDEGSHFGATVPAFPGVFAAGLDGEDAVYQAQDALISHLDTMVAMNMPIVVNQEPLEKLQADPDLEGGVWTTIDVDLSKYGLEAKAKSGAKIIIETDDPALSAALQMVIAEALNVRYDFGNVQVKSVMITNKVRVPGQFDLVEAACLAYGGERSDPIREAPVLRRATWMLPGGDLGVSLVMKEIVKRNPDLLSSPIVIDGYQHDVCENYQQAEDEFLGKKKE